MPDYRGISPEVDGQANLGSPTQMWGKVYAKVIPGAFNKKETFTTSGTFVAPYTGTYRITLQGGGGGGAGAGTTEESVHSGGGGGGAGARIETYEKLTADTSYSYVVGAGGAGGTAGSDTARTGGDGSDGTASSIIINGNTYIAGGGYKGLGYGSGFGAGRGGEATINGVSAPCNGFCGSTGSLNPTIGKHCAGGCGGGAGGSYGFPTNNYASTFGGGGGGGNIGATGSYSSGADGAGGYISFEYYDTNA